MCYFTQIFSLNILYFGAGVAGSTAKMKDKEAF
jgi:hypothetical protein